MVKIGTIRAISSKEQIVSLSHSDTDAFVYTYYLENDCVHISIKHYENLEDTFHDIAFFTEWHTKRIHPKKIVIHTPNTLHKVLYQNGYYPKGKVYQRLLDPERLLVRDSVFDEEGYIIDQGDMSCIPFGWFDTARKGCGWIAAYNLLKANGIALNMSDVRHDLEQHALLGKVFGQEVLWLVLYLKKKGLSVNLSMPGIQGCINASHHCNTGILAYMHTRGAHYAMFSSCENGKVHFYNAEYKRKHHVEDMSSFLTQHCILHGCFIIACEKR